MGASISRKASKYQLCMDEFDKSINIYNLTIPTPDDWGITRTIDIERFYKDHLTDTHIFRSSISNGNYIWTCANNSKSRDIFLLYEKEMKDILIYCIKNNVYIKVI